MNAMHGNEQMQETFCAKVWQYFCKHNIFETIHTSSSLTSWWSMINKKTDKFYGFMAKNWSKESKWCDWPNEGINYITTVSKY